MDERKGYLCFMELYKEWWISMVFIYEKDKKNINSLVPPYRISSFAKIIILLSYKSFEMWLAKSAVQCLAPSRFNIY